MSDSTKLSYHQFLSKNKGKYTRHELKQKWKEYKSSKITDEIDEKEKIEKTEITEKTNILKDYVQYDMTFQFSGLEEDVKNTLEIVNSRLRPILFALHTKVIKKLEKNMTKNDYYGKKLIIMANNYLKGYEYMTTSYLFRSLNMLLSLNGIIIPAWIQKK